MLAFKYPRTGQPVLGFGQFMNIKKYIFLLILLFFNIFSFAKENCTQDVDCQESINENSYNIDIGLSSLNTFLSIGITEPIQVISKSDLLVFNNNMQDFIQLWGIYAGLSLFASAFSIGLFLYKR